MGPCRRRSAARPGDAPRKGARAFRGRRLMAWLSLAWKAGPWIAAALAITFALYERSGWFAEEAARAADQVAAQQAVRKAQVADAMHTREIEDAHAAEIIFLKEHA